MDNAYVDETHRYGSTNSIETTTYRIRQLSAINTLFIINSISHAKVITAAENNFARNNSLIMHNDFQITYATCIITMRYLYENNYQFR